MLIHQILLVFEVNEKIQKDFKTLSNLKMRREATEILLKNNYVVSLDEEGPFYQWSRLFIEN